MLVLLLLVLLFKSSWNSVGRSHCTNDKKQHVFNNRGNLSVPRGVIPAYPQDVPENRHQLREIVFSTYAACTEPDPEGDGREFTVRRTLVTDEYH